MELSMSDLRELIGGKDVVLPEDCSHGLHRLVGRQVAVWCMNYIYAGTLVEVRESVAVLDDAKVVYQTGPLKGDSWEDAQDLPSQWAVCLSAIESFGQMVKS